MWIYHHRLFQSVKLEHMTMPDRKNTTFSITTLSRLIGGTLLLALALLAAACTGASPAASSTPSVTPTFAGDTIQFSNIQQTPAAGSVRVDVSLVEFSISSSITVFHAGVHYYFVIANKGHVVHEFTILPDKPDGTPLPTAMQYENKIIEIEQIAPGTTMRVNLTFSPSQAGRYEIACMMRGHYQAGMRLPVQVTS